MDEVIDSHYNWYVHEYTHKAIATGFGLISAASLAVFSIAALV